MATIEVFYEVWKGNTLIERKPSKSFVRNFSAMLWGILNNANVQMVDVSGTRRTVRTSTDFNYRKAQVGYGTSNEPVDFDQHELLHIVDRKEADAIIRQDLGTGERVIISKSFVYTGNQNITVWEIGLYGYFYDTRGRAYLFLLARDVLETGLPLAPGEGMTVRYIIEIKV